MKIVYSGFDSIYFAARGALAAPVIEQLKLAKEQAANEKQDVPVRLGNGRVNCQLKPKGAKGGYAFVLNTGPTGFQFLLKESLDRTSFNGFIKLSSLGLAVHGWKLFLEKAVQTLDAIGFTHNRISLNRVDYCMDFLDVKVTFEPNRFVAHPRVQKKFHEGEASTSHVGKVAVAQSDTWKSMTLGKLPGKQIIIYDKRREVLDKRKPVWFDIWQIDKEDPVNTVHRIELRLGKDALKNSHISTIESFEKTIGTTMNALTQSIRYIAPLENDSNISRQPNDPLWDTVQGHVSRDLLEHSSRITEPEITKSLLEQKAREYLAQFLGNFSGYVAIKVSPGENMTREILGLAREALEEELSREGSQFYKSYYRSRERFEVL